MLGWDVGADSQLLIVNLLTGRGRISGSKVKVWGWDLGLGSKYPDTN